MYSFWGRIGLDSDTFKDFSLAWFYYKDVILMAPNILQYLDDHPLAHWLLFGLAAD